jgi:predicted Zn-dependent protease
MITPQELIEKITLAADYEDCIVIVESKTQANLRWANSTLTTNGVIAEQSVTVIAFVAVEGGMAAGSITRTNVDSSEVAEIAKAAGNAARAAGKAEDAAELLKNHSVGDWSAPHPATGPDVFAAIAPDLGDMFQRSVADAIELFGYAEHTHKTYWIGSKGGLRLRFDQPDGRVEMTGKSHGRTRSTWEGRATRDFKNLSIADIDSAIRERLEWQSRKIEVPAGHYDTVAPAGCVSDIFTYMMWSSAAKDAYEGRSVFSNKDKDSTAKTRVGEIFSKLPVNLYSDPSYQGLECSPFIGATSSSSMSSVFDNGQTSEKVDWLTGGKLTSLIQTRATSKLTGLNYTPFGENIIMDVDGAMGNLNSLISQVKSGLLLTTLWYIRMVDPTSLLLTGLTRDGVYQIVDGEVTGAVNNFRWNESPVELLERISAAGETSITQPREWAGDVERAATPPVIFEGFNMSTISPGS